MALSLPCPSEGAGAEDWLSSPSWVGGASGAFDSLFDALVGLGVNCSGPNGGNQAHAKMLKIVEVLSTTNSVGGLQHFVCLRLSNTVSYE